MPSIHKTLWLVKEVVVVVVVGGGGGGQNIMAIIKMTPPPPPPPPHPPNCRIQDVTLLALFVHLSGLFISFYFHAFNTYNFVVGERGGGGGDGGGGWGGGRGVKILWPL